MASMALAQPAAAPLTVEQAVAIALRENPLVRAAARQTEAARAGVGAARSLSNPSVTVTPSVAGTAGSDEELSVAQPLELNGVRRARSGVARADLRAAEADALIVTRDLVRDVRLAYYDLARAQEVLALQQESVAAASEFERIARRQVELGSRPGIDLTQLQVELTRARQLELRARSDVRLAEAALNTLMGRAPDAAIGPVAHLTTEGSSQLAAPSSQPEPSQPGAGSREPGAASAASPQRPEVAVEQARLDALRQQDRLIRTEGRPDVTIAGRLESFTREPRVGGVGIGISLPLFDYGSRRHRLRQTRRLAEAQAARVEATWNKVRLEVEQATSRLRTAEQLVRQYQEGLLDQARRLAEAERTRFQTGAGSPLLVLEAQRTYRSVLSDYYGALAAREQAKAELAWARGGE
jgi:cobalt-zinc-cadmium efflux system outer membrane protein